MDSPSQPWKSVRGTTLIPGNEGPAQQLVVGERLVMSDHVKRTLASERNGEEFMEMEGEGQSL